ncbi:MAG TPA: hypothetical protein DC054_13435 [Blastocatellia bacterium]|nr:hypothetical protein [Blastocatellia bacterium]
MIYTFYSYKGGVGRSMALANVAEWFYQQGLRVIMIDWDLEAPGLENFFYSEKSDLDVVRSQLGLIDLLLSYKRAFPRLRHLVPKANLPSTENPAAGDLNQGFLQTLRENLPPVSDALFPIKSTEESSVKGGALWLMPAGWRVGDRFPVYAQAVQSFDWSDFYASFEGETYFNWMREQLVAENLADVVLIDSRTGVTEMGGVCTRQLADIVVSFVVPNAQNLGGVYDMTKSFGRDEIVEKRQRSLDTVIIPSRVDISEVNDRKAFEDQFRATLDEFTPPAFRSVNSSFWDLAIQYVPKFAYREQLAINDQRVPELEKAYKKLTVHLALLAQGPSGERVRDKCQNELQREFASHLPSVYQLSDEERARYLQLGFFPENAPIRLSEAQELWKLDTGSAEKLVYRLDSISLVKYHPELQAFWLNSVLRAKVLEQIPDQSTLNETIEAAFLRLDPAIQVLAPRLFTRLLLVAPKEEGEDTRQRLRVNELDGVSRLAVDALAEVKLVTIDNDDQSTGPVAQIANESYVTSWNRLRKWVDEDRDFLLWRQQLKSKIAEWEATKRDQGALLSGVPLTLAQQWREKRPNDLNVAESGYIDASSVAMELAANRQKENALGQQRKRRRLYAVVMAVWLIIIAGVLVFYVRQRRADVARRQAEEEAQKKADDLVSRGSLELSARNLDSAVTYFNQAIDAKPDDADAYLKRARTYELMGTDKWNLAVDDYTKAIQLKPDLAVAYFERADIYSQFLFSNASDDKAIADYTTAIKIRPDYWDAYLNRGYSYESSQQFESAIRDYDQIINSSSGQLKPQAYVRRGFSYAGAGNKQQAIQDFLEANQQTADPKIRSQAGQGLALAGYTATKDHNRTELTVFVEYNDLKDGAAADGVCEVLRGKNFNVKPKELTDSSTAGDVRYYHREDEAAATLIKSIVAPLLSARRKSNVSFDMKLIYLGERYQNVPGGYIEVWIPSLQKSLPPISQQNLPKS